MALSALIVWEARTTGASTNGGGFKAGASGTDWSQQNAAQYAVTDLVTDGSSTVTSISANFGTDVVGNLAYITGGTGSITAGLYEIITRNSSLSITLDRATGLSVGTGATINIGGAISVLSTINTNIVAGQTVYVKATANYTFTAGITLTAGAGNAYVNWIGYTTTRGDNGKATIITSTNSLTLITAGSRTRFTNFIIDSNNTTGGTCYSFGSASFARLLNCHLKNFKTAGQTFASPANCLCESVWATGGSSGSAPFVGSGGLVKHVNCVASANAATGFAASFNGSLECIRCISASNTGATTDGFSTGAGTNGSAVLLQCIAYANGRDGVRVTSTNGDGLFIRNSIFVGNTGYGINCPTAGQLVDEDYCAFQGNGTAARNNVTAGASDVTLSGDPFTNAASGDFSLDNTSGEGVACRGVGFPGAFQGISTTGYSDIGAAQHQDSGSSGAMMRPVGMNGGLV